jgi:hypothetical protein
VGDDGNIPQMVIRQKVGHDSFFSLLHGFSGPAGLSKINIGALFTRAVLKKRLQMRLFVSEFPVIAFFRILIVPGPLTPTDYSLRALAKVAN